MKTKLILVSLFAIIISGCKNGQPGNKFKVILDVVAKEEDDFCLFYTTDGTIEFTENATVWQHVKGKPEQQQVVISLPEGVDPTQLRIDVGFNRKREDITLKGITFESNGKKKEIRGKELPLFFRADNSKCTFDGKTGIIKAIVVNGQKQVPSLYPQEVYLGPALKLLAK